MNKYLLKIYEAYNKIKPYENDMVKEIKFRIMEI